MNPSPLKILIISFFFPPYNKVGGRRWAKHFKYLILSNIPTFVIAGNFSGKSPWDKDIEAIKNNIFRIEHTINPKPFFQTLLPNGTIEKIKWKLSMYRWNLLKNNLEGNYNDLSLNNEIKYLNKAIELIKEKQINTVILSVGPFKYSSIIIELKKLFPKIKFVIDYRDYWEDSLSGLSKKQIATEKELQKNVINSVDLILSPNNEMQKYYGSKFNADSFCLPHCFDDNDIKQIISVNKHDDKSVHLIYGGAFYSDISENIYLIKQFIDKLLRVKNVSADFYVSIKGYEKELLHPAIKRHDFIDTDVFFTKVKNADFAILILPPNRVNAMSSKFYELVALRIPILYFGGKGEVSEFIVKNKLGYHIDKENIDAQVQNIINNLSQHTKPNVNYDISKHTFKYQTGLLIDKLISLQNT